MLLFLLAESDVDGPGQGHLCLDLGERVMRMSSSLIAPSAVAILSIALLCGLNGTAMSQTAKLFHLASQRHGPGAEPSGEATSQAGAVGKHWCRSPGSTSRSDVRSKTTRTAPPAPGSVMAKLAQLERTGSNCTDGCQTSFKYGNQPWNGCSGSGAEFGFSTTCRNVRNYKTYYECKDTTQFLGWRNNDAWWYCSSLLAGGKLAGEKLQVAELKRSGRR